MKVNPEIGSVINVVKPNDRNEKRTEVSSEQKEKIADSITLENKQASKSYVDTVEQAKSVLSQVIVGMENHSSDLYNVNLQRVTSLIQ